MAIFNSYVKLPEGIYTPRNYFGKQIAGGKILLNLRRKLVKTPEFCKKAGEFKKCWIYRCMLKQQKTEMISTYNYAGI
jgi:hypothetical protein